MLLLRCSSVSWIASFTSGVEISTPLLCRDNKRDSTPSTALLYSASPDSLRLEEIVVPDTLIQAPLSSRSVILEYGDICGLGRFELG